jgi:hypothetical protein
MRRQFGFLVAGFINNGTMTAPALSRAPRLLRLSA